MSNSWHDDRELGARFATARAVEARRAPSFERVLRGPPRGRRSLWAPALVLAATVVAVGIGIWQAGSRPVSPFEVTVGALGGPTDFLLRTSEPLAFELPDLPLEAEGLDPALEGWFGDTLGRDRL
ncbi:MAG: hypothetical protein AB7R55_05840 [Gemmatimonadales bacterium]